MFDAHNMFQWEGCDTKNLPALAHTNDPEKPPKFDGQTFKDKLDGPRLTKQLDRVREYMLAIFPAWKSLAEISYDLRWKYGGEFPEASISARLRDLRKKEFGGYIVEGKRREGKEHQGIWEYLVYRS